MAIFGLTEAILRHLGTPGALRTGFAGYNEFSRKNQCATGNPAERSFFLKILRGY
jgi:hypothetical protein